MQVRDVALGKQRFSVVAAVEGPGLPVTVTLDPAAEYENCAPSSPLPLTRVIWKAGETVLAEVGPAKAGQRWRCAYTYKTALGDSTRASPEDCKRSLPFRAQGRFEVIRGFDGAPTHQGRVKHAIDFAMPESTPVLSAREGVVTWIHATARTFDRAHARGRRAARPMQKPGSPPHQFSEDRKHGPHEHAHE